MSILKPAHMAFVFDVLLTTFDWGPFSRCNTLCSKEHACKNGTNGAKQMKVLQAKSMENTTGTIKNAQTLVGSSQTGSGRKASKAKCGLVGIDKH
eukprot:2682308-Amphidinium_carterae.2